MKQLYTFLVPICIVFILSLSSYNCIGQAYQIVHNFDDTGSIGHANGAYPQGSLLLSGKIFYGMTIQGGYDNKGTIFSVDSDGSNYKDLLDFNGTNGHGPYGSLIVSGNVLYGTVYGGGPNNWGIVFSIHTDGSAYKEMLVFNWTDGAYPIGSLILSGNMLYGTTNAGGTGGYGTVFAIDTTGARYKDLLNFNGTSGGENPSGNLALAGSELFGATYRGGANSDGIIYEIDTTGVYYKDILDFNVTNGASPEGSLTWAGNKLYGLTYSGGANNIGCVFSIDTTGAAYKDLMDFKGANGSSPTYNALILSGGLLYGMTPYGGSGNGNIFSIDTDGSGYNSIYNFNGISGRGPSGNLTICGHNYYGMVNDGGNNGAGDIFCFNDSISKAIQTGTWSLVKNPSPHSALDGLVLLTDGTVICHTNNDGGDGRGWDRLTPDSTGSYINGTWDTIAPMTYDRYAFSSQLLPSGKVYVAGGEYGTGGNHGEVYDPVSNTWTTCGPIPAGWNIYDGNSEILYNGNVLEGPQIADTTSKNNLIWSPITLNYIVGANAIYDHDEASWLKLRDSSIITIGAPTIYSDRYIPRLNKWVNDGVVPGRVWDGAEESGGSMLLPNGKAIFFGATPFNALYTPSNDTNPGTWSAADSFPVIAGYHMCQPDAPSAMMVNGHILCAVSPYALTEYAPPCYFVEYDYTYNAFFQVTDTIPGQGYDYFSSETTPVNMLDLPDGNVLVSNQSHQFYIYTPGSGPIPQGKPTINSILPNGCPSYKITGKLFNGISEGATYGDDWQMETNYPLVRLSNGTKVYYARTSYWNRIGAVQTDSLEDTAIFTLPNIPAGTYSLVVVANGFASNPVLFTTFGISISTINNVSCYGDSNASIISSPTGGIQPYTYSWTPGGGKGSIASNLKPGTYTITATDANGCIATASASISQPASALAETMASQTNILCYGDTGNATANMATGGTSPYIYNWTPSGGTNLMAPSLTAGTYTITAIDNNGCTAIAFATITQPASALAETIASQTNVLCYGDTGNATANMATGGTSPYTYNWIPSGGTNLMASNLTAGTYTIAATDLNGCTATASMTITQPAGITIAHDSVSQSGPCNGMAGVSVSGGTLPYTFLWSPGGQTNDTIDNQCAGSYCCSVTDNNGCTTTTCVTVLLTTTTGAISNVNREITIYPDPNNGNFIVSGLVQGQLISLYDCLGREIKSDVAEGTEIQWDISSMADGIYFISIKNKDGSIFTQKKIVKMQ